MQRSSGPWRCQVLLRYETDDHGERLKASDVREEAFGPVIRDKALVEDMLRRAQLAILNPTVPPERFENFDFKTKPTTAPFGSMRQLQFSANVVCLDLQSPDSADLSFIDLPGTSCLIVSGIVRLHAF